MNEYTSYALKVIKHHPTCKETTKACISKAYGLIRQKWETLDKHQYKFHHKIAHSDLEKFWHRLPWLLYNFNDNNYNYNYNNN